MAHREILTQDAPEPCPYLPGRTARLPLRWQTRPLTPAELDLALDAGDRRVGRMLYRTACAPCRACEPLRILVDDFTPTRSQRRVWRRNADVTVETGPVTFTEEKLALFNRHKLERGLSESGTPLTRLGYTGWFVDACCPAVEMRYRVGTRLVAVGILDVGARDTSSVYFYFDPDEHKRSLGVFSVLVEMAWQKARGGRYHYLGLYVEDCAHLRYKATYFPHERLVGGAWARVEAPAGALSDAPAME
jgi:arginine-tRNA-protein transferase